MPYQAIPFAAPMYQPRHDDAITQLLMRQGDIAARGQERSSELWGNAIQNIGNIGAGVVGQVMQQKAAQKREAAFGEALSSWDPTDPHGSVMRLARVTGPDDALKFATGLMTLDSVMQKNAKGEVPSLEELKAAVVAANVLHKNSPGLFAQQYPNLRAQFGAAFKQHLGFDLPPQPTPEIEQGLGALAQEWGTKKPEGGFTLPPGSIRFDESGKQVAAAPAEPARMTIEQELNAASKAGNPEEVKRLLEVKRQEAMAGRDPSAGADRAAGRDQARLDKSYQFNSAQLETVRKPLMDQAERFGRLVETVDQKTPAADALIAPELLTVMAGGAGSGLRMNEAEISRIVGGRGALESLKAKLMKFNPNANEALSITDSQRQQMKRLITAISLRMASKVALINGAAQSLVSASDVETHRQTMADLKEKLTSVGEPDEGWTELPGGIRIREKK